MRLLLLGLLIAGCSTHSIEPRGKYDDPEHLPVAENVLTFPGPGGNFRVTWDYEDTVFEIIDGFFVERAPFVAGVLAGDFIRLNETLLQEREFEDRSNLPEGGYAYRIVSATAAGVTRPTPWVVGFVDVDPPDPPELTLDIIDAEAGTVRLSWTEPAEDVVAYRLFRVPEFFQGLPFLEVTGTELEDFGLQQGVTYTYWVKAVDRGLNESANSNLEAVQLGP